MTSLRLAFLVLVPAALLACKSSPEAGIEPDAGTPEVRVPGQHVLVGALGGPGNLDGPREKARFLVATGMARDGQGNVYVTEAGTNVIRKITPDGTVSTFAGVSMRAGDVDGPGAIAQFSAPVDLVADAAGNLFVVDSGNDCIRKVAPDGTVSTFAGAPNIAGLHQDGIGQEARFADLRGITIDAAGNLYVAERAHNDIRKITPERVVTTYVGVPTGDQSAIQKDGPAAEAGLATPMDVVSDAEGNLWIIEAGRLVLSPDGSSAGNSNTVRYVSKEGQVSTLVGRFDAGWGHVDGQGSEARLDSPMSITRDAQGILYVAEFSNVLRRVTPEGRVSTVAGGYLQAGNVDGPADVARLESPFAVLAVPGAGGSSELLVATPTALRRVDAQGTVSTWAGSLSPYGDADGAARDARFRRISCVVPDGQGGVVLCDVGNSTLRRVAADGTVSTLAGKAGERGFADGVGAEARFNGPMAAVRGPDGALYVADVGNNVVRRVTLAGEVSVWAGKVDPAGGYKDGPRQEALFSAPLALAFDARGRLFVSDFRTYAIRMVDTDGQVTTIAGVGRPGFKDGSGLQAAFGGVYGLAVDPEGNVFVADSYNHALRRLAPSSASASGWEVTTVAGALRDAEGEGTPGMADGTANAARFSLPTSLAFDELGDLYVTDYGNSLVRKVTQTAVVSTVVGTPWVLGTVEGPLPGSLLEPWGIASLGDGRLLLGLDTAVLDVQLP